MSRTCAFGAALRMCTSRRTNDRGCLLTWRNASLLAIRKATRVGGSTIQLPSVSSSQNALSLTKGTFLDSRTGTPLLLRFPSLPALLIRRLYRLRSPLTLSLSRYLLSSSQRLQLLVLRGRLHHSLHLSITKTSQLFSKSCLKLNSLQSRLIAFLRFCLSLLRLQLVLCTIHLHHLLLLAQEPLEVALWCLSLCKSLLVVLHGLTTLLVNGGRLHSTNHTPLLLLLRVIDHRMCLALQLSNLLLLQLLLHRIRRNPSQTTPLSTSLLLQRPLDVCTLASLCLILAI